MTRSEIEEATLAVAKKLSGVARAFRQSDAYHETQGAADLDAIETEFTPMLQAIAASTETDADMQRLKAWRQQKIAEFTALRAIATERASLLTGKTEIPNA